MENRINMLLNGLVRENRERQMERAAAEAGGDNDYQEKVNRANMESEAVEFLRDLRGLHGRE